MKKPSDRVREIINERGSPILTSRENKIDAVLAYLDERWEAEQANKNPFVEGMNEAWKEIKEKK